MPEKSKTPLLPVTLVSTEMSPEGNVLRNEAIKLSLNKRLLLVEIVCSYIISSDVFQCATHSVRMLILDLTTGDRLHERKVVIKGGIEKTRIELQPPIQFEPNCRYVILLHSDGIPQNLFTQKANFPVEPFELAPGISIHFYHKPDHCLISQLLFKHASKS